jgi:tetratricopeptide (TPR) repeat protein
LAQEPPLVRAKALMKAGRPAEAVPLLFQAYESDPHDLDVCQQLGIAYTAMHQFPKAVLFYRKALQIDPSFMPARKNLATVLWFLGAKQESEQEFASVLKRQPEDPVSHLYVGLAEFERRRYASAKHHFEKAGPLALNNPELLPAAVESYLVVKDTSLADRLLKELEQAERPDPDLTFRLGALLSRYGFYGRAISVFEKLAAANLATLKALLMLAEMYDKQGMPEKAYSVYAKAIAMQPASAEAYVALANFASTHGNNEFASRVVEEGLQRIPGSAKLLFEQGVILALDGRREQAEESFRKASQAEARWSLPLLALGISQLEGGNLSEAASTFRQAARIAPDDYRAEYLYATALTRAGDVGRREEIIAALRRAISLNGRDPRPRISLGQAYAASGRPDAAIAEFKSALKLDPKNPTALYQLGLLYRKQGNTQAAERLLRAFQENKAKAVEQESAAVQILKILKVSDQESGSQEDDASR